MKFYAILLAMKKCTHCIVVMVIQHILQPVKVHLCLLAGKEEPPGMWVVLGQTARETRRQTHSRGKASTPKLLSGHYTDKSVGQSPRKKPTPCNCALITGNIFLTSSTFPPLPYTLTHMSMYDVATWGAPRMASHTTHYGRRGVMVHAAPCKWSS